MPTIEADARVALSLGVDLVPVRLRAVAGTAVRGARRIAWGDAGIGTAGIPPAGELPAGAVCRPERLTEVLSVGVLNRVEVGELLADIAVAQARLHALQSAAITRLTELQPVRSGLPGARREGGADDGADPADRPDDWVADEVACVLGIGVSSVVWLVDKQRVLHQQLPAVWAALADGLVDVRRAQVLVDALAHRKRSAGGGVADAVIDEVAAQGLAWITEGVGPTRLADRVTGVVIAADPDEAVRRAEKRQRKQNVTLVGAGDGLAGLRADLLSAEDAAAMQARVDAMAAVWRKGGDTRPVGVLRVESLKQLVLRPWEALPDGVTGTGGQLRVRVDLADLDNAGPLATGPRDGDPIAAQKPTGWPATGRAREDTCGSGVGSVGGVPVPAVAVAELLARYEALQLTAPPGGEVWFEIVDTTGRLRALTTPDQLGRVAAHDAGLGPPPAVDGYAPSAGQIRFVRARDTYCRFPGCSRPAEYADLDHVVPHGHHDSTRGGPTCVTNLICLCRRHHRLKTHAEGWVFRMEPDGTLHVTPPTGQTRTTRPPGMAEATIAAAGTTTAIASAAGRVAAVSPDGAVATERSDAGTPHSRTALSTGVGAPTGSVVSTAPGDQVDPFTAMFGPTPSRYRSPTPDERAERRATATERAHVAAAIHADLDRLGAEARRVTDQMPSPAADEGRAVEPAPDEGRVDTDDLPPF